MKKFLSLMLVGCMIGAGILTGCKNGKDPDEEDPDKPDPGTPEVADDSIQTDRDSLDFVFNDLYNDKTMIDTANGFSQASDVTGGRFFVNGKYYKTISEVQSRQDVKLELYNDQAARMVNVSAGMEFTIPTTEEITVDYTLAALRTQYHFDDSVLTFSAESKNPYTSLSNAWYVYINEWGIRHLVNDTYYANQNLTWLNKDTLKFKVNQVDEKTGTSDGVRTYPTVPNGDLTTRPGYEIYRFDILVNEDVAEGETGRIERPYYNIGIIHDVKDNVNCGFFVMKSKENKAELMDAIMMSYRKISSKGLQRTYFDPGKPVEDPNWNEETTNFFRSFMTQKKKSWGVFNYSMPGDANSLVPGSGSYNEIYNKSVKIQNYIEEQCWGGKKFDVYMTYTHIGRGRDAQSIAAADAFHYYPLEMSKALAGGNGDGTKPVLEFTYQFTTNNNLVDQELTPMFDILRGDYDEYFAGLAKDIKAYGAPVMFRLNNEMNTDWTSYSGVMTLLDPDIFNLTWIHLYNIFIENGVDNVVWVWNPIADSCPYSGWGEDLCYFPGVEYVQLLGGTSYEFNNYAAETVDQEIVNFKKRYTALYEKNAKYFEEWGMIIGEFGCGSGGEIDSKTGKETVLGRNREAQAKWIEGMFEELNSDNPDPYVQQIKGLIWFNANDYINGKITNRLKFTDAEIGDRRGEDYLDLKDYAWKAFAKGFKDAEKFEN